MSATALIVDAAPRPVPGDLRVAFVGPARWIESCAPSDAMSGMCPLRVASDGQGGGLDAPSLAAFAPAITVIFAPERFAVRRLRELPGLTLGVLTATVDEEVGPDTKAVVDALDRTLSFRPALSGVTLGEVRVWRAIPPPVADRWFSQVVALHDRRPAMTLGGSTAHREALLMPAKHHHDVLQILYGVGGTMLAEVLAEHRVAIYAPALVSGGFGPQVGMHLAAGQLLIAEGLDPLHGLEPGLDFIPFRSPDELVHRLDRLARFPEMYRRIRLRGRMKAEGFRASRVFARVLDDLRGDVATFGSHRRQT